MYDPYDAVQLALAHVLRLERSIKDDRRNLAVYKLAADVRESNGVDVRALRTLIQVLISKIGYQEGEIKRFRQLVCPREQAHA